MSNKFRSRYDYPGLPRFHDLVLVVCCVAFVLMITGLIWVVCTAPWLIPLVFCFGFLTAGILEIRGLDDVEDRKMHLSRAFLFLYIAAFFAIIVLWICQWVVNSGVIVGIGAVPLFVYCIIKTIGGRP